MQGGASFSVPSKLLYSPLQHLFLLCTTQSKQSVNLDFSDVSMVDEDASDVNFLKAMPRLSPAKGIPWRVQ